MSVELKTTVGVTSISVDSYPNAGSGTFACHYIECDDTTAAFYKDRGGNKYTGSIYIVDGATSEEVRILEVVNSTHLYVEQLVNSYTPATTYITFYGYDGTPNTGELAKNSTDLYLYPSYNNADQGINKDRVDLRELKDNVELAQVPLQNFSSGCIIKLDTSASGSGKIKVVGTSSRPIVFADEGIVFVEDATKSLNLSGLSYGFYAIYVEEDTSDTPAVSDTLPIKLSYEFCGSTVTTPSVSNKYLIGYVYLKDDQILGAYSLETPNAPMIVAYDWGADTFTFDGTSYTYKSSKTKYVPVFTNSYVFFSFNGMMWTSADSTDSINFRLVMRMDDTTDSESFKYRLSPLDPNINVWSSNTNVEGLFECSTGIHYFELGGKLETDDADRKSSYKMSRLRGNFIVVPKEFCYNVEI